jgi:hypothetical protein
MELRAVLLVGLLLILPQLVGLLVTRLARSASWTVWPAAAISVFGAVFYWCLWVPARTAAEQWETHCGMWQVALGIALVIGLTTHLGLGILFGPLVRRRLRSRSAPPA